MKYEDTGLAKNSKLLEDCFNATYDSFVKEYYKTPKSKTGFDEVYKNVILRRPLFLASFNDSIDEELIAADMILSGIHNAGLDIPLSKLYKEYPYLADAMNAVLSLSSLGYKADYTKVDDNLKPFIKAGFFMLFQEQIKPFEGLEPEKMGPMASMANFSSLYELYREIGGEHTPNMDKAFEEDFEEFHSRLLTYTISDEYDCKAREYSAKARARQKNNKSKP